jgi:Glycosyl transferase family 11
LISVHLSGGLGNQLFQYAAGLALARRLGTNLRIDARKFAKVDSASEDPAARPLRILDLDLPFRDLCTRDEENNLRRRWNLAKNLHLPKEWLGFYTDADHRFSTRFHALQDGTRLQGYFQSELYFSNIADEIRRVFQWPDKARHSAIHARLVPFRRDHQPLVSVHIRRGDFLQITAYDAMTSDDFLPRAMQEFAGAHFLLFSDDLNWCRSQFAGREDVSFSPFANVLDDFFAMSHCDHHILAKSTFSWWAAWLNDNSQKRILAPRIAIETKPAWGGGSPDYYPAGWTLL